MAGQHAVVSSDSILRIIGFLAQSSSGVSSTGRSSNMLSCGVVPYILSDMGGPTGACNTTDIMPPSRIWAEALSPREWHFSNALG